MLKRAAKSTHIELLQRSAPAALGALLALAALVTPATSQALAPRGGWRISSDGVSGNFPNNVDESGRLLMAVAEVAQGIEDGVDYTAERIDVMLAGKRYTREANESNASLTQFISYTEGGLIKNSTDFGVNLRLPNLEKKWQLRFSSFDEREEERRTSQRYVRTEPRPKEYGAAVRFFRQLGNVRATFQPRLELRDPLEMSYILRFESIGERKRLKVAPKLELFADAQKGTGEYSSFNVNYDLTKVWELLFINDQEYRDFDNLLTVNNGTSISRALNDQMSAGATLMFLSTNRPLYNLEQYTFAPGFSHILAVNRIRYVVSPYIIFARMNSWKGVTGISANMDITF